MKSFVKYGWFLFSFRVPGFSKALIHDNMGFYGKWNLAETLHEDWICHLTFWWLCGLICKLKFMLKHCWEYDDVIDSRALQSTLQTKYERCLVPEPNYQKSNNDKESFQIWRIKNGWYNHAATQSGNLRYKN